MANMKTDGYLLPDDLRERLLKICRRDVFANLNFTALGFGVLLLGLVFIGDKNLAEPADAGEGMGGIIFAVLWILMIGSVYAFLSAAALRRVKKNQFMYLSGTVQRKRKKRGRYGEVTACELSVDGEECTCSLGMYAKIREGDGCVLIFFPQKEESSYILQTDAAATQNRAVMQPGTAMSAAVRKRLRKQLLPGLGSLAVVLAAASVWIWILCSYDGTTFSTEAHKVLSACLTTLGVLMMLKRMIISGFGTAIAILRTYSGAFTYHAGTLQELDMRIVKRTHSEHPGHYNVHFYYMTVDSWALSCSKKEYEQAELGDQYAVVFFGSDQPKCFVRTDGD